MFVFWDNGRVAAAILCLLISGLWMLDTSDLPRGITARNYLNVLGAWELSSDKNESREQCQFLVKRGKCCLTWFNCVLRSLPLHPWLWIWLLTVRKQSCRLEKRPWIGLYIIFETTLFCLYFSLFNIIINSFKNQWIKRSAVRNERVWHSSLTHYWSWL